MRQSRSDSERVGQDLPLVVPLASICFKTLSNLSCKSVKI